MEKNHKYFLILVLLVAFLIRFINVDKIPSGLYYDEIDAGYIARSLIQTGKDYRGTLSPFFMNSFLDPRPPIPIYFTVISTLIFPTPELQVRMSSVILGTINIGLVFWLIYRWRKKFWLAFLISVVFALNPWQVQFSRFNHEAQSTAFFLLLGLNFFYKALESSKRRYFYLASIVLSFGMYTYRTMSLFVPIVFFSLILIYRKEILKFGKKAILIAFGISALIILPFLYSTTIGAADKPRIAQISVFSDPTIPIWVQRSRELDSGDVSFQGVGKKAPFTSFVFHNKPISYVTAFFDNYLQTFSMNFLFLRGDSNHRHSIPNQGMFYLADLVALIFAIYFLFTNFNKKEVKFLILLILFAPIASSLTIDGGGHGSRLFIFSVPFLILIGFGWQTFFEIISKLKYSKIYLGCVSVLYLVLVLFYFHNYFVHFPINSANMFGYGYKQATQKIMSEMNNYKRVELTQTKDPPMLYFFFWGNIPPKQVQKYGTQFSSDIIKNQPLDAFKTSDLSTDASDTAVLLAAMKPGTIYLVTTKELPLDLRHQAAPKGVKLLDVINYPNGEVDFYIIAKEI